MAWRKLKLGNLIDYQNGLWVGKTGKFTRAKVVRVTEMKDNGTYDLSTAKELQVEERKLEKRRIVPNSILLERSGGGENKPVGRVVLFGDDVLNDVYSFSNFTTLLFPKVDVVLPKYIFYFLYFFHLSGKTKLLQKAVTGIRNLEFKKYLEQELPIPFKNGKPDLAEQKRIADKLDKVFAKTEKGADIASKEKAQTALLKKSLLTKVFSDSKLQKVKLGDYFDVAWGNTSITKKSYTQKGYTAYSAAGADGFLYHYEHEGKGIILSAIGARCGKCFLADGKWTAIKNTIVMTSKPDHFIDEKYAWYFLNEEEKWRSKGAGQPFITQTRAIGMEIPVPLKDDKPDLVEQRRIVKKLDTAFALLEKLGNLFARQETSFANLRASVLNEAFALKPQVSPVPVSAQAVVAPKIFDIQQAIALILKRFERGEMVVAKLLYLAQKIYKVPLGIQFSAQNFGPYDRVVKKAVTAGLSPRNKFFTKKGFGNTQVLSLGPNANKILKYANSALARKMNDYLDATMPYFSKSDSNSIERLATICKIIEDEKTTDEKIIKAKLQEWKPNKFQDAEVSRTIAFIKKQKWDTKLIT